MANATAGTSGGKRNFVLMALLVVILAGTAIYANVWKENRHINDVVVEGNKIVAVKDILALAKVPSGTLLFELDIYAVEQRVTKNEFVRSVAVHRDIPNRVRITIEERIPVAAMVMDKLYYLDVEGVVLPPATSQFIFDLPVITGVAQGSDCTPGKRTKSKNVLAALELLATARDIDEEVYRNISEIHIDGDKDFVFYTAEFGIPVLLGRDRIGQKLVKFEAFWKSVAAQQGAHLLQYVDLRFEDQVVVRWNRTDGDVHS